MEHLIDALDLAGFEYDLLGGLYPLVIVKRWNGTGSLHVTVNHVDGVAVVTEIWDGQSRTDTYDVWTVVSWITSQAHL